MKDKLKPFVERIGGTMTYGDAIRAMTDEDLAEFLQGTDWVKITRCKDCFHFAPGTEKFDAFCVHNSVPVDEDGMGFCSEGVKKTEILDDPMEGADHDSV